MYRIFCESYQNFIDSFDKDNYRLEMSMPLELIVNISKYREEEKKQSELFKKVSDLIFFMEENVERFPKEFCFQLEQKEFQNLRCQFVTSSFEKQKCRDHHINFTKL